MLNKIKNTINDIKQDITFSNEMKKMFLEMALIGLMVFLSIFWKWFALIGLVVACGCVLRHINGKSIYFIFFLLPLISMFKLSSTGIYLLIVLIVFIIFVLAIKLLISLLNKNTRINIPLTTICAVLFLYMIPRLKLSNITMFCSFVLGLVLVYITYYYKDEMSFKEISFAFLVGMVISVLTGLLYPVNERLQMFIDGFTAGGVYRFSACAANVNIFAGELMIMLALFTALFMKKQIKSTYWLVYIFSFLSVIFTISKSSLIMFVFITVALVIYIILDQKKYCYKQLLILISCLMLVFLIVPNRVIIYFSRPFNETSANPATVNTQLSGLTTGRFDIWITYFKEIGSSLKSMLFGFGMSAENIGIYNGVADFTTHNTFVQMLYNVGVVGVALLLCVIVTFIGWKKVFKLRFGIVVVIVSVMLFLCGADFFSYRLSNYLILIFMAYSIYDDKPIVGEKVDNNTNQHVNSGKKRVMFLTSVFSNLTGGTKYNKNLIEQIVNTTYFDVDIKTDKDFGYENGMRWFGLSAENMEYNKGVIT